jgi:hypothetical protein
MLCMWTGRLPHARWEVMPSRYSPAHEHMSGVSSRSEIGVRLQLTKLDCN